MFSQGFFALATNAVICHQRAVLPIQPGATAQCQPAKYNDCLACFKFLKKSVPNGHYYLQRAVTLPDNSAE
jgi:hypothetical protein